MRKPILAIALAVAASQAAAEGNEEYQAAGFQAGLAAQCRATYGQHDLFEVAFTNYKAVVKETGTDLSEEELAKIKQELYAFEAQPEGNVFLEMACKKLTDHFLPGPVSE